MRQVWVLSDDPRIESRLRSALTENRYHVKYRVQIAQTLDNVPEAHFLDPGVTFLVDAFHPGLPGFEGLKQLRARGFTGPVFLIGEPAPEEAVDPFLHDQLTGFLPPVDRLDMSFAAGLLHSFHHFQGEMTLEWFLDLGGKSAVEQVANMKDFNQLLMKLTGFVSRFGADAQRIKRALVALSSSHVTNTAQGPVVAKPFKIFYGMDAGKLLLSASLDPEENKHVDYLQDFGRTLGQVKATGKASSPSQANLLNVAKITSNLVYVGGNCRAGAEPASVLLTMISFTKDRSVQVDPYFFAYVIARPSQEMASQSPERRALFEPTVVGDARAPGGAASAPSGLDEIADEKVSTASVEAVETAASVSVGVADAELAQKLQHAESERKRYEKVSEALAADVKRLMKERREPLTDPDLRESLKEIEARLKHLQDQNKKLTDLAAQKESQIELLSAQVERLKKTAA